MDVITPSDPNQSGCQLSLRFSCSIEDVHHKLHQQGIIVSMFVVVVPSVFNLCCVVEPDIMYHASGSYCRDGEKVGMAHKIIFKNQLQFLK